MAANHSPPPIVTKTYAVLLKEGFVAPMKQVELRVVQFGKVCQSIHIAITLSHKSVP